MESVSVGANEEILSYVESDISMLIDFIDIYLLLIG